MSAVYPYASSREPSACSCDESITPAYGATVRNTLLSQLVHIHTLWFWHFKYSNLIAVSLLQAIFGIISDRFGRKWPLVYNLILVALFELGTLRTDLPSVSRRALAIWYRHERRMGLGGVDGTRESSGGSSRSRIGHLAAR